MKPLINLTISHSTHLPFTIHHSPFTIHNFQINVLANPIKRRFFIMADG